MSVRILQWSAWVPGVTTKPEWIDFFRGSRALGKEGHPDVSGISPLLRRRMSRLARMSAAVATDCCRKAGISASGVRTVFASRHGEMGVTVDLLSQMIAGESLSPMGFSSSVHHTSLAYFSMASGNRKAMRAVAGGEASFCYGFLDAIGMLGETDKSPVLLVAADDEVPAPFDRTAGRRHGPYAAAFLLGRPITGRGERVSLKMPSPGLGRRTQAREKKAPGVPVLNFLKWFLESKLPMELVLSGRRWRWEK